MTKGIARIVAGMLKSEKGFSVRGAMVWIPFQQNPFQIQDHIAHALRLHGYEVKGRNHRSYAGLELGVPGARELSDYELRDVLQETYGYSGRIAGLSHENQAFEIKAIEPGNILEIPAIGWLGDESRVVIGEYSGIYVAKVHTDTLEVHDSTRTLRVVHPAYDRSETTPEELINRNEVIVKRREWSGYPQQQIT
ncbi:hypothetical protein [Natronorubrum tibetense]|uniref:Uncharacterized protein n=1 Tax=Natronorubrum tibetense GA33 TaxID=1114856 RepID=L9VRL9_9EURY|nr:hypothetical protein [Natronorubrum tibetense]ELY39850.1 hypothetical protein C496_14271 [Natronorubrum tibetense GA33]